MKYKILTFSEVLEILVHERNHSIPEVTQRYIATVKKYSTVNYDLKIEYIIDYGLIVEVTTAQQISHVIQILDSNKMLFDVYNDNKPGYNNIRKYTSFPPKSEEEYFQASTVADLWFTLDEALTLLDIRGKEADEFANRIT